MSARTSESSLRNGLESKRRAVSLLWRCCVGEFATNRLARAAADANRGAGLRVRQSSAYDREGVAGREEDRIRVPRCEGERAVRPHARRGLHDRRRERSHHAAQEIGGSPMASTMTIPYVFRSNAEQYEGVRPMNIYRSEEHTSELQSQSNLVCRLLLEKKKKNNKYD